MKRDFDKAASSWDENPGRVKMAGCVAGAIRAEIPISSDMDAIDYGCGTGLITFALQPYLRSITGLDSSQGMLDELERKASDQGISNVHTMRADLENGTVPNLQVNLLTTSMTMHHISDIGTVLRAFNGMLCDGGYLAVADLDSEGGEFHADNTGVVHFGFDRDDFTQMLKSSGFEDIKATTACIFPKEVAGKGIREFTIFLITAKKHA